MATTARFNRKVAPRAATTAEAPATTTPVKASFFARVKTAVVKTASRVIAFVKTQARKVALVARVTVSRVKPIVKRAWTVALRPFLGGVIAGASLGVLVVGALVAPATTVLMLLVGGGMFVLLARGVKHLEDSAHVSRFSRVMLNVFEVIGQALRALAYAGAALLAIATCAVSLPFAVFSVLALTLAYFDVRGGGTIAFLAWCVLSGSWGFGLLWLMWRGASRLSFKQAAADVVDVPEYSEIRRRPPVEHAHVLRANHVAVGTEGVTHIYAEADAALAEMATENVENAHACDACGTTKGALRVRSNAVSFTTVGGENFGKPHEPSNAMLCSDCYDAECEDNAIALTGVSLRKRSVNVVINAAGHADLPEAVASKADTSQVFWAVTAWWRDRKGHHHDRQWDCFHDGKSIATVTYDHTRKVYRATALGKFLGTKTGLGVAQRLAADAYNDALNTVDSRPNSPQHAGVRGFVVGGVS